MRWISAAGDAFRFGEASCRLLVLLQQDRAFSSLRLPERARLEAPATAAAAAAAASRHSDGGGGGDGDGGGSSGSGGRPSSPLTPYAMGLAFGSRAVAKLIVARDAEGVTPPASPAAAPRRRLRRLSFGGGGVSGGGDGSWLLDGGGGGDSGGGAPVFPAEPTLGREVSVLRRSTSALDDVTLKWRAVCVGPGGACAAQRANTQRCSLWCIGWQPSTRPHTG